ncbi:MAG: hypothetical protein HYT08_04675 [Candidatus Levybacteria bacterium]|nr:hypothetical protein [Candidatus Levybacteria bacterium]
MDLGNSHYKLLKKEWGKRHKSIRSKFEEKHREALNKLSAGAASLILLSSSLNPATALAAATTQTPPPLIEEKNKVETFLKELNSIIPQNVRPLNPEEEATISAKLSEFFGMDVMPAINGLRLNRTYGVIGAEQHLIRYPGDNMATHFTSIINSNLFYSSGMAPGRGAWGYFANSKGELTPADIEKERWYIAVQTFAALDYNKRLREYRDFFKYRKMLIVNPLTGQSVVSDIADAGPAVWTGKHLGGSPEVMHFLGLSEGPRKGAVLYFFINDPDDKIPLGPINLK